MQPYQQENRFHFKKIDSVPKVLCNKNVHNNFLSHKAHWDFTINGGGHSAGKGD